MSVKIRLRRMGSRGKPFYRMVVADSRTARNGRFIEQLGYYNPCTDPATISIDEEKALLWLGRGAQPTETVGALLKKQNIMDKFLAAKPAKAGAPVEAEVEAVEPEEVKAPVRKRRTKAAAEAPEAAAEEPQAAAEPEPAPEEQPSEAQG